MSKRRGRHTKRRGGWATKSESEAAGVARAFRELEENRRRIEEQGSAGTPSGRGSSWKRGESPSSSRGR